MKKALVGLFILCIMVFNGCVELNNNSRTSEVIPVKEAYEVVSGYFLTTSRIEILTTVASWTGSETREITYKAKTSPWVINWGYTPTSKLASSLDVTVYEETKYGFGITVIPAGNTLVEETGDFKIMVKSSGCKWWVKIGVE